MGPRVLNERRQHPRLRVILDGHWKAESAPGFYQVSNLSLGGCFIQSLKLPRPGETGAVTIYFRNDGPMTMEAEVVHVSTAVGFAVRFPNLTSSHQFQLGMQLETLKDDENVDHFPLSAYIWKTTKPQTEESPPPDPSDREVEEVHDSGAKKARTRKHSH
jgi:PilZ domain